MDILLLIYIFHDALCSFLKAAKLSSRGSLLEPQSKVAGLLQACRGLMQFTPKAYVIEEIGTVSV